MSKNYISRFSGQVAVVTGAANGIGFVTAKLFAEQGATVVLVDRDAEPLQKATQSLAADKLDVHAHVTDISIEDQVDSLASDVDKTHGRIDILAHLAGVYPINPYPMDDLSFDNWRNVHQINLDGTFLLARAVLPIMRRQQYGRIINTSSIAVDIVGMNGISAYVASKSGVIGLTRALAHEAGPDGITANAVMPGLIETDRIKASSENKEVNDAAFEHFLSRQCIKRRGQSEDIAHCITYLASPDAGFVTGQTISINGGVSF